MLAHRVAFWCSAAVLVALSSPASATTQRTFVASTGVDNPNCSIAAPCRNFASAIIATNTGGEIIVQDSAGYGKVTITKAVSIISPPGIYAGISVFSGDGVTVDAPGATVVLRGLSINGQGGANGILLIQADRMRTENCVISNMGGYGIVHQANNAEMIVLDTIVRDNLHGIGMNGMGVSIVLDRVRSEHNSGLGFYMVPAGSGTLVRAAIADSFFANNGSHGIWAESVGGAATRILVERTVLAGNADGFYATAGAAGASIEATLSRNSFTGHSSTAIHAVGSVPGQVSTYVSENSFTQAGQIASDGSGSILHASGNTGTATLLCENGATVYSYGNNYVASKFPLGCAISVITAY